MDKRTCGEPDCDLPVKGRGMCRRHYLIWYRAAGAQPPPFLGAECATEGCSGRAGKYTGICRPCYSRRYERENAGRIRERRSLDNERIREHRKLLAREYRAADPERFRRANARFRARHPERVRESQRRYSQSDKGVLSHREKARRRRAQVGSVKVDYAAILERDGMFCHICSMVIVDVSDLHFDHVIALAAGGEHSEENIKPAHAICNLRKGSRVA